MTQEEKSLLLRDLCARLPYGVICKVEEYNGYENRIIEGYSNGYFLTGITEYEIDEIVPYLRPMDSMTEDEKRDFQNKAGGIIFMKACIDIGHNLMWEVSSTIIDWLNAHHFDFRNLIGRKLALEAPADMYKTKED